MIISRAAAIVLVLAVISVFWVAAVRPLYVSYLSGQDRLAELVKLKNRLALMIAANEPGATMINEAEKAAYKSAFLPLGEAAVVLAEVQGRVRAILDRNGCEVSSTRNLPEKVENDQSFLGIHVQVRCPMRGMRDSIYFIEVGKPYLFAELVALQLDQRRVGMEETTVEGMTAMHGEFHIYGARWTQAYDEAKR